jgi:hypothetical protein
VQSHITIILKIIEMKKKVPSAGPLPEFEQSIAEMSDEAKRNVDLHFNLASKHIERLIVRGALLAPPLSDGNKLLLSIIKNETQPLPSAPIKK